MKKDWYKHGAWAAVIFTEVMTVLCFLIGNQLKAQDTVTFNAVEIKVIKFDLSELGKKTEHIDSSSKEQFKFNYLNDLLSNHSTVFVKNYGPGSIATTALRGGNAIQTAILWNGFNLQNTMLGLSDLSLLPSFLFNDVAIEYGGSSSVWGSGAIAGSIHLNSYSKFGGGDFSAFSIGSGSYGKLNSTALAQFSRKKFYSSSKIYLNRSENNFKYSDTTDKENPTKYAKDASYVSKGFMQDFEFLVKNNQRISLNAWVHDSKRNLQANDPQMTSKANQLDNAIRLMASWSYSKRIFYSVLKSAYFQDKINYNDSINSIYSKSMTRSFMIENDNYFQWFKNQQFNLSVSLLSSAANSDNYDSKKDLNRISILAGNKFIFLKEKLVVYPSLRFEYYTINALPITGNISVDYKLLPSVILKLNTAKVYRQPTLNELYWQPGGNINLKPEQGYTFEAEVSYTKKIKYFSFYVSLSAYSRQINNWILWVPGDNGNPTPLNIQDVWSRGTETSWKLSYQKDNFRIGCSFMTSYVLATIESTEHENDNSVGKQLIYTPRYALSGTAFIALNHFEIYYYHQYFGYRFTSSDNATWLDPYHVASLRANYSITTGKLKFLLFAACNNLYNQNYTVMESRPMPLRNYEVGITVQLRTKN